jgi:hypothetical protein
MTPDEYLNAILTREAVNTGPLSPVRGVQSVIYPIIQKWAGNRLLNVHPSGSFMKGTANSTGTDIDLFVSLSEETTETLKEIYEKLFNTVKANGYTPTRQNVSINIRVNGFSVDLVPAKRQNNWGEDHSLYRRRAETWTKTNVAEHIRHVGNSGRLREIRTLKLWRDQKGIDFPSFYLELVVINALPWQIGETLAGNVWRVFEYLKANITSARIVDPANTNNTISDDSTLADKSKISAAASAALRAGTWGEIVT